MAKVETVEQVYRPPYIYVGLHDHEELMSRPAQDSHVRAFRELEEDARWKRQCERGGMHRFGQCPYCGFFYD